MQTRPLGRTGLTITRIGLGAQTVGGLGYGPQDWSKSQAAVEAYLAGGGRFIDTARGYGTSEIWVGKALKASGLRPDEVVVCSKSGTLHPPCTRADLEVSRFCLQRDWIDVYTVHVPPADPDALDRILDAYCQFKAEGLIRHVGLSCRHLGVNQTFDEVRSWFRDPRVEVIQFPCSIISPEIAVLLAEAAAAGKGVVVRGTVAQGALDDRILPGHRFTDTANDWRASVPEADMERIIALVQELKTRFVKPPYTCVAQLSQAWVLAQAGVSTIIAGGGTPDEVKASLATDAVPPLSAAAAAEILRLARQIAPLLDRRKRAPAPSEKAARALAQASAKKPARKALKTAAKVVAKKAGKTKKKPAARRR